MRSKNAVWAGLIGLGATIAIEVPAIATNPVEIADTAKAITVLISTTNQQASGVILQHQGDVYTILTAAHAISKKSKYTITTADDRRYPIIDNSIRFAPGNIDLAVVQFRSTAKYRTAKIGNCQRLKSGMDLYVAGFPAATRVMTQSAFVFREGKVSANSARVFEDGYSLVYSNDTLPGMSGGPVLNDDGELVAIHGKGDREEIGGGEVGEKTGFNVGIAIDRFIGIADKMSVTIAQRMAPLPQSTTLSADDYIATGIRKYRDRNYRTSLADFDLALQLDPNLALAYYYRGNIKAYRLQPNDAQGALADFDRAIQIDPKLAIAYNYRGLLKERYLQDERGALADYDRAISLKPQLISAYNHRGVLKANKLQDIPGGLADFDRAIQIDPSYAGSYNNRAAIKVRKLQDFQGALADFNLAIQTNPQYANAYGLRAILKYNRLNDRAGAIADMQQSAKLYQQQNRTNRYQWANELLTKWQKTTRRLPPDKFTDD